MTDTCLTPWTRHSQLPIAVVLGTDEIASTVAVNLTAKVIFYRKSQAAAAMRARKPCAPPRDICSMPGI
ncbi:hypothetical protein [Bradyrhizobium sp.]|uniref:hypothetical protein n=1 Tax=Bradyrhizobium sp. TaxID=376 RepID=UPI003C145489